MPQRRRRGRSPQSRADAFHAGAIQGRREAIVLPSPVAMLPASSSDQRGSYRLGFLSPARESAPGLATIRVDLRRFFDEVARLGPEASVMLLALRALRLREPGGVVDIDQLAWMLVADPATVLGWMERLSQAGKLVYERRGPRALVVELIGAVADPSIGPLTGKVGPPREIPTYLFTQVLPRARVSAFLLYLALLAEEDGVAPRPRVTEEVLRREASVRSVRRVRFELWRLTRMRLIRRTRSGRGLLVCDPPPLSPWNRRYLQLLQWGYRPLPWRRIVVASIAIALVLLILGYLVTHPRDVLLRPPLRDDERADARGLAGLLPRP